MHFFNCKSTKNVVVFFDFVGAGKSDLTAYNRQKYLSLDCYVNVVIEILDDKSKHINFSCSEITFTPEDSYQEGKLKKKETGFSSILAFSWIKI